jgi:hypothetical protein
LEEDDDAGQRVNRVCEVFLVQPSLGRLLFVGDFAQPAACALQEQVPGNHVLTKAPNIEGFHDCGREF